MSTRSRLVPILATAGMLTAAVTGVTPAGAAGSRALRPGLAGGAITLGHHLALNASSADIATSKNGTAYVAWIASAADSSTLRAVYLCVLPPHATACKGGVQTTDALGDSSAADLKVLFVAGSPTLYWFHDTADSISGPEGAAIAAATVTSAGVLSAATDVAAAPSFGQMFDTEVAPNGDVWTITYAGLPSRTLQVREGLSGAVTNVSTPWGVGRALIAWDHGQPIIAITKYGEIGTGPYYASGSFSSFHPVAHTWAVGTDIGLVNAGGHVRIITGIGNASYWPVVATWTGSGFGHAAPTGDHNNASPSSHDVTADASGRMADVENETGKITVNNLADDKHTALFRFSAGGTIAGFSPQLSTSPRGHGWVLWAIEESNSQGNVLKVAPLLLPGLHRSVRRSGTHGSVVLTGPASCLPADAIPIGVTGKAAKGWKATRRVLKLGSHKVASPLNGAALTPGKTYPLKGTVKFRNKKTHATSTVKSKLSFRSCPNP